MSVLFYVAGLTLLLLLAALALSRANPTRLADGLRIAGPTVLGIGGVVLLFFGRAGLGGMLISAALGWFLSMRNRRQTRSTPGTRSHVRTASLEMELDHDSGGLEGLVLAGRFEGRQLSQMSLDELLELRELIRADPESLPLIETYLDGRFPAWREDADTDAGGGEGGAPASGPMSEQEAYQILGLEAGATTAEIRKAHRRLMQRLHPDIGGSSFLAARINEAKDVLLNAQR